MLSNCGAGEDSWESVWQQGDQTSQSLRKSTLNIHWKDWCWSWSSSTLATWQEELIVGKDPDAGKDNGQEAKRVTKDEMVGWHHLLNEHEFWQIPGDSQRQGSLMCCSAWGCKQSDMTEQLNNRNPVNIKYPSAQLFKLLLLTMTTRWQHYFMSNFFFQSCKFLII